MRTNALFFMMMWGILGVAETNEKRSDSGRQPEKFAPSDDYSEGKSPTPPPVYLAPQCIHGPLGITTIL